MCNICIFVDRLLVDPSLATSMMVCLSGKRAKPVCILCNITCGTHITISPRAARPARRSADPQERVSRAAGGLRESTACLQPGPRPPGSREEKPECVDCELLSLQTDHWSLFNVFLLFQSTSIAMKSSKNFTKKPMSESRYPPDVVFQS